MSTARIVVGSLLLFLIGFPLLFPLMTAFGDRNAWLAWREADRIFSLARNSLLLTGGVVALALPAGTFVAVLFYRTDLPFRRFFRFAALLPLFIPLPLFTAAWQIVASGGAWTPWRYDLVSAICIHAVAALPWVILIVGLGLTWVERELEEDALTQLPPWRVLFAVTLPRSTAALGAAALLIALQTATEITVTDLMQVRTFAEEVYTQFVGPDTDPARGDPLARAVAVNMPFVAATALLVGWTTWRWERSLPARATLATPPYAYSLGWLRWPIAAVCLVVIVRLVSVPIYYLVQRAGVSGVPLAWTLHTLLGSVQKVSIVESHFIAKSLLWALTAGVVAVALAFVACRLSLESPGFRVALVALIAVAWAMPGPIVGLGLKAFMGALLDLTHSEMIGNLLWYSNQSPLPVIWVDLIRFFPCAVAMLWPVMRLEPRELRDAARVDGAGVLREWRSVALPLSMGACVRAVLAVAVLSLGELSASKLVSTPGQPSYSEVLFAQMHYGITNDLAARCLVMLGLVMIGGGLALALGRGR